MLESGYLSDAPLHDLAGEWNTENLSGIRAGSSVCRWKRNCYIEGFRGKGRNCRNLGQRCWRLQSICKG